MKAVLTLTWTYFAATRLTRGLASLGLLLLVIGAASYALTPVTMYNTGPARDFSSLEMVMLSMPWLGLLMIIASTALLPKIAEQICLGRGAWILPGGRAILLISIAMTAALIAILTAVGATAAFVDFPVEMELGRIFYRTLLMAFIDLGLIYTAIWLVGKTSGLWRLVGLIWVIVSITIPLRYIGSVPPFTPLEAFGLLCWLAFGVIVLAGGRFRHSFRQLRARTRALAARALPASGYRPQTEVALLLGTTRPWIVAIGQLVPIAVMVGFIREPGAWIVFIVTFSAISGAITSHAAARSRRLWLRYDWTRARIHHKVELTFWQYNAWFLAVLLLAFAGLAVYADFSATMLLLGLTLVCVSIAASHYLGLTITRGLGWFEAILAILTMITQALGAFAIMRGQWIVAIELQVLLAVLAIAFRIIGRRRWLLIDWMRCQA